MSEPSSRSSPATSQAGEGEHERAVALDIRSTTPPKPSSSAPQSMILGALDLEILAVFGHVSGREQRVAQIDHEEGCRGAFFRQPFAMGQPWPPVGRRE